MSTDQNNFNPPGHPPFKPHYSHISKVPISDSAEIVSFAGQIGRNWSGGIPSTLVEQVKVALENVDLCLKAARVTKKDIIQVRQYIVDLHPLDPGRAKLYAEWMSDYKPPSTVLGVQSLADEKLKYEIEVIAILRK